jgi:hypothetical protein
MIRIEGTLGQSQERRAHVISSYDIINETKFRDIISSQIICCLLE